MERKRKRWKYFLFWGKKERKVRKLVHLVIKWRSWNYTELKWRPKKLKPETEEEGYVVEVCSVFLSVAKRKRLVYDVRKTSAKKCCNMEWREELRRREKKVVICENKTLLLRSQRAKIHLWGDNVDPWLWTSFNLLFPFYPSICFFFLIIARFSPDLSVRVLLK